MTSHVQGIVLAGGKSSRMGRDKALLPINKKPLITHVTDELFRLCEGVSVVGTPEDKRRYAPYVDPRTTFVEDIYPGHGPLSGIHAGLSSLVHEHAFVLACDMPVISTALLVKMKQAIEHSSYDAVLCADQPFHAFYHKRAAAAAEACLKSGQRKMHMFLQSIACLYLPVEEDCFLNLNTPQDYAAFVQMLQQSPSKS